MRPINITIDEPLTTCAHHWKIESPQGTWSLGICRKCGEYDAFKNSIDVDSWSRVAKKPKTSGGSLKGRPSSLETRDDDGPTKTEFLESCIPPRLAQDGTYTEDFKTKMVSLAVNGTRSFVRTKFNIPETTLRRWIKTYQQGGEYETR